MVSANLRQLYDLITRRGDPFTDMVRTVAENNPANEYPDEELSFSDEDDDPTAIYRKYRHRATSDDEEFDIDDSGSEGAARYGSGYGFSNRYAGDRDSDEESY